MDTELKKSALIDFLGSLTIHLIYSKKLYRDYIDNGKLFKHALILKAINTEIRNILLQKSYVLPDILIEDSINIITHIDLWLVLWEENNKIKSPGLYDEFSFNNDDSFPKESEKALLSYYHEIINLK